MRYHKIFLIALVCLTQLSLLSLAQDPHSSLNQNPTTSNPAAIGTSDLYEGRFIANLRNQWTTVLKDNAFRTSQFGFDQRIALGRKDYFGLGTLISHDQAGSAELQNLSLGIGASLLKNLNVNRFHRTFLSLGFFSSWNSRSINTSKLLLPSQIINSPSSLNSISTDQISYLDTGIGLQFWDNPDKGAKHSIRLGGALWHINTPKLGFLNGTSYRLPYRIVLHAGGHLNINPKQDGIDMPIYVIGNLLWEQHGNIQKYLPSLKLRFDLKSIWTNSFFQVGIGGRFVNTLAGQPTDAMVFSASYRIQQLQISLSYDLNISPLANASQGVGGFELGAMYFLDTDTDVNRGIYCPMF